MSGTERGAAGADAALAVTALLAMLLLTVGGLRTTGSAGDVQAAARAGARAAVSQAEPDTGRAAAEGVVADSLAQRGVACAHLAIEVAGSWSPGGIVRVDVSCEVDLTGASLGGFDSNRTVSGTGIEMVDLLRSGQ